MPFEVPLTRTFSVVKYGNFPSSPPLPSRRGNSLLPHTEDSHGFLSPLSNSSGIDVEVGFTVSKPHWDEIQDLPEPEFPRPINPVCRRSDDEADDDDEADGNDRIETFYADATGSQMRTQDDSDIEIGSSALSIDENSGRETDSYSADDEEIVYHDDGLPDRPRTLPSTHLDSPEVEPTPTPENSHGKSSNSKSRFLPFGKAPPRGYKKLQRVVRDDSDDERWQPGDGFSKQEAQPLGLPIGSKRKVSELTSAIGFLDLTQASNTSQKTAKKQQQQQQLQQQQRGHFDEQDAGDPRAKRRRLAPSFDAANDSDLDGRRKREDARRRRTGDRKKKRSKDMDTDRDRGEQNVGEKVSPPATTGDADAPAGGELPRDDQEMADVQTGFGTDDGHTDASRPYLPCSVKGESPAGPPSRDRTAFSCHDKDEEPKTDSTWQTYEVSQSDIEIKERPVGSPQ